MSDDGRSRPGAPLSVPEAIRRLEANDPALMNLMRGGLSKIERITALMEWLSDWLTGSADRDGEPLHVIDSDFRARIERGEDPVLVLVELGVPPEHAEILDELARYVADGFRIFAPQAPMEEAASIEVSIGEIERLYRRLRGGEPEADWGILMLPLDFSEVDRLRALRRIVSRLHGRPFHPTRWAMNKERLVAAAEDLGLDVGDVSDTTAWLAILEAGIEDLTVRETLETRKAWSEWRRALQKLLCDELLPDHDWKRSRSRSVSSVEEAVLGRSDPGHGPLEDAALQTAFLREATMNSDDALLAEAVVSERPAAWGVEDEAALAAAVVNAVDRLAELAALTPAERELVDAYFSTGDFPEAARFLGIKQEAMRARKSGLMRKLAKAAGHSP